MNAKTIIEKLKLTPHPESGHYKETYRADLKIVNDKQEDRSACTAIYYLLENEEKALFHRLHSDEIWLFHAGQALEIISIEKGELITNILGNDVEKGEVPQLVIPGNSWFAAQLKDQKGFSLVTVTVSPGFDFADFDLAKREDLSIEFPHLADAILRFTR